MGKVKGGKRAMRKLSVCRFCYLRSFLPEAVDHTPSQNTYTNKWYKKKSKGDNEGEKRTFQANETTVDCCFSIHRAFVVKEMLTPHTGRHNAFFGERKKEKWSFSDNPSSCWFMREWVDEEWMVDDGMKMPSFSFTSCNNMHIVCLSLFFYKTDYVMPLLTTLLTLTHSFAHSFHWPLR